MRRRRRGLFLIAGMALFSIYLELESGLSIVQLEDGSGYLHLE